MNKLSIVLLSVAIFSLFSCQPEPMTNPTDPGSTPNSEPDFVVETITPTGEERFLNTASDYIFDQEKLHTFELNLPNAALEQIDADPVAEEYVEGTLTFEGEKVSPVGIRYKGSIGAFVNCVSGSDWANPSGRKTCTKLSMKIKINWDGADTKFYGLKKLQFHSMNNDPSQFRERLGYWLFRKMNVPAPRATHARLMINGTYVGLFALVEQIDGRFTRYNYEDGKGNLYKEVWPLHSNGTPHSDAHYLAGLKTNEDENPSLELIKGFAQVMATADEIERQQIVSEWMDMEEVISYAVVDRTIRNDDGAFHWYCEGTACSPHNFYWYEETDKARLHLIPWDLDHAFENIISNVNWVTPIADAWGATRNNCAPFSFGFLGVRQRSAACDKIIGTWASFTEEYEQAATHFKEVVLAEHEIDALLDTWMTQIEAATIEAKETHSDAISTATWKNAVNQLKAQLEYARSH